MQTPNKSGFAPVNGIEMYYEIYGEGHVPLVLVHGGGSTIETSFGNMIPLLSLHTKLIAVELQAHGRTTDRDAPESFQQDADDVAALLGYLGIEKADLFGFSNGGSTVLQVAIRHPNIVNKVIAASAACKRDGLLPGFFDGMQHATIEMMPQPLKDAFLKLTPDEDRLQNMFNKDKDRMLQFKDWEDESLNNIKAPVLFLSSDQDVITPEHTVQMARMVPGSRIAILPGQHGAFIGATEGAKAEDYLPGITATLVKEFLS